MYEVVSHKMDVRGWGLGHLFYILFSLRSRLLSYFTPCLHIDKVSIVCTAIKHVLIHSQSVIHVLRLSAGGSQTTPGQNLTELCVSASVHFTPVFVKTHVKTSPYVLQSLFRS